APVAAPPPPIVAPAPPAAPTPVVEPLDPESGADHAQLAPGGELPVPEAAAAVAPARRRKTATLIVGSSPPGAEILLDGEALGAAPTRVEGPGLREGRDED